MYGVIFMQIGGTCGCFLFDKMILCDLDVCIFVLNSFYLDNLSLFFVIFFTF